MKRLYVKPQYRKYKIGEALVNEILLQAKQLNYTVIKLDTLERLQPPFNCILKKGLLLVTLIMKIHYPMYMEKQLTIYMVKRNRNVYPKPLF
jgi:GNAT superfamily N-acetyltransferase